MATCRMRGCEEPARGGGGFEGAFCSTPCELKYEHIRDDARDARMADRVDDQVVTPP